jgi:hypothetical protein
VSLFCVINTHKVLQKEIRNGPGPLKSLSTLSLLWRQGKHWKGWSISLFKIRWKTTEYVNSLGVKWLKYNYWIVTQEDMKHAFFLPSLKWVLEFFLRWKCESRMCLKNLHADCRQAGKWNAMEGTYLDHFDFLYSLSYWSCRSQIRNQHCRCFTGTSRVVSSFDRGICSDWEFCGVGWFSLSVWRPVFFKTQLVKQLHG